MYDFLLPLCGEIKITIELATEVGERCWNTYSWRFHAWRAATRNALLQV